MIVCTGLCAAYGQRVVLRSVNFSAKAGEFVAVLGPNGSGKTTFLRVLAGGARVKAGAALTISPDTGAGVPAYLQTGNPKVPPTGALTRQAGAVRLCGDDLDALRPRERARRVAVVPQRVDFLPPILARELVLLGRYPYLSWLGAYSREDHAAVSAALEAVGAEILAARPVRELSGGELQRVLLARALAQDTPILLLDELTAGLDLARMVDLFDVLDSRRRAGACVVAVMHDVNLAALYATRLVGLKEGSLRFDGAVEQVFTEELLRELYDIPIHVFPHPAASVPQACPGRRAPVPGAALADAAPADGAYSTEPVDNAGHDRHGAGRHHRY